MKLLDFALAPNPKKVRVYLREKGLDIPIEQVDVMGGKNRTPEFLSGANPLGGPPGVERGAGKNRPPESLRGANPLGGLPVLELDDGKYLPESLAIMEYLEEMHPNPPLH